MLALNAKKTPDEKTLRMSDDIHKKEIKLYLSVALLMWLLPFQFFALSLDLACFIISIKSSVLREAIDSLFGFIFIVAQKYI